MTPEDKLRLARTIYTREGFFQEFLSRLGDGRTSSEIYYALEQDHDDLFGEFKFPTLNAFSVWRSKRRRSNREG